jgi:hypothetical protein
LLSEPTSPFITGGALRLALWGGGFVFNAVHCVQANTAAVNILALFDAVQEFNGAR